MSVDSLQVDKSPMTNVTAQRDKMVDWLFFANKDTGKFGQGIRELLIPQYTVGPSSQNIYFRLSERDDASTTSSQNKSSFSFCCNQSLLAGQWPMAFKYALRSPGRANNCNASYPYSLDSPLGTYQGASDRCDVDHIGQLFPAGNYLFCDLFPTHFPLPFMTNGAIRVRF